MGYLKTPTGKRITRTVETIPASCDISNVYLKPDGSFGIDFCGETDVGWDGQETVNVEGWLLFEDEDGQPWLEHQLIYVENGSEELDALDLIKRMARELTPDYEGDIILGADEHRHNEWWEQIKKIAKEH